MTTGFLYIWDILSGFFFFCMYFHFGGRILAIYRKEIRGEDIVLGS